jgi:hypothetical protein
MSITDFLVPDQPAGRLSRNAVSFLLLPGRFGDRIRPWASLTPARLHKDLAWLP